MIQNIHYQMEFHISRPSRDYYRFDESIFKFDGNVIFNNFNAVRLFAKKMNDRKDVHRYPERAVKASQINAMGLIDEILHLVIELYREQIKQNVIDELLRALIDEFSVEQTEKTLKVFTEQFPPLTVYRKEISVEEYLSGDSIRSNGQSVPNRVLVLEELILLWLANLNPAFGSFQELFNDDVLRKETNYLEVMDFTYKFFEDQPHFGPKNQNLIEMLLSPAKVSPYSLSGQLDYISSQWGYLLGKFLYRILRSLDLIREEEKISFGVGGASLSYVYDYAGLEAELEAFSPDSDWMPNLVMIAKNTYVWLDQLSKEYGTTISRLDEIPEQELDKLASWGISGLWLIGVWERSKASKTIKQLRGNPEAVASAYSLYSYEIAAELGGYEAFKTLKDRAWKRSIRMASDMVPNHMGIDSQWVVEHPDWFISLDYSPFPSYSFSGPNLSWDDRVGIYIEDHYYDNSDAAVVFKRVDRWTGTEKYVYHGNDGTSMPWNDTAQLNYLLPQVREAVIKTILHVARLFPIIRFDAAMTLAKRHYQRLWFPEPGSGGDIPSRAEYGISKAQFNQAFPKEFWREVVDRVSQEVPDTLLLAEAFWLMEGYFVRTLGMHRVYNSAFMNMLRDEKNQEYRLVIKNTLEFDPEILKRYVNFMNNPDERTAVDQFGKSDKYFGICTMLATMPGLPMLGHGQVEGYTEKYGMEYQRAYWDEKPDPYLVRRHEKEIFPLLKKRYLFSGVADFRLYDFFTHDGYVNEDVFAYSNRSSDERALVIYHNKYAKTSGWIRLSSAYPIKSSAADSAQKSVVQKTIGEGLGIRNDSQFFTIFNDHNSGLQYIRNSQRLHSQGLYAELNAYQCQVFTGFYEVQDNDQQIYARLEAYLEGRGVPDIEDAVHEIILMPVRSQYRELVNAGMLDWLSSIADQEMDDVPDLVESLKQVGNKSEALLKQIKIFSGGDADIEKIKSKIIEETQSLMEVSKYLNPDSLAQSGNYQVAWDFLVKGNSESGGFISNFKVNFFTLLIWIFTHHIGEVLYSANEVKFDALEQSRTWIDEWLFGKILIDTYTAIEVNHGIAERYVLLLKILTSSANWYTTLIEGDQQIKPIMRIWLADPEVQEFLKINRYKDILWFNKESFEEFTWWMYVISVVKIYSHEKKSTNCNNEISENVEKKIEACFKVINDLLEVSEKSGYRVDKLMEVIN